MARNEEKQLGRLNRFYLQQQREEEQKKNPPRPKLDSLHTAEEVKKWLPSILKDIDFYVKQMEVSCYPQRQIDEFNRRIDGLRGEYKAFVGKLRTLSPGLESIPWTDRPYQGKRKRENSGVKGSVDNSDSNNDSAPQRSTPEKNVCTASPTSDLKSFVPLSTPVLANDKLFENCYGYEKHKEPPPLNNIDEDAVDTPLDFNFTSSPSDKELAVVVPFKKKLEASSRHAWSSTVAKSNNSNTLCLKQFIPSATEESAERSSDKFMTALQDSVHSGDHSQGSLLCYRPVEIQTSSSCVDSSDHRYQGINVTNECKSIKYSDGLTSDTGVNATFRNRLAKDSSQITSDYVTDSSGLHNEKVVSNNTQRSLTIAASSSSISSDQKKSVQSSGAFQSSLISKTPTSNSGLIPYSDSSSSEDDTK